MHYKLPPDPDGKNNDRAQWAEAAISAFEAETGTDRADALADLLADLMHWCDRTGDSFDVAIKRAKRNYKDETQDD